MKSIEAQADKLIKVKALCSDQRTPRNERKNASRILAAAWIFIDIATIERSKKEIYKIKKKHWVERLKFLFWFNPLIVK